MPEPEVLLFSTAPTRRAFPYSPAVLARLRSVSAVDVAVTLVFAIILIVQIERHDMWRDEIHSWGLVLASPSLSDLFENLRFTGHPSLWYLLLWLASHFTDSPYTVQIVHAAIALLLIGVIGLFSPFSRLERLLLLSSYFVLYEYTVVSRNYGIGLLIALIYAQMRATRPDRLYLNALLLGLLANTNLFAFVLSAALAFEYLLDRLLLHRGNIKTALQGVLPAAMVYVAFVAASAATVWPSSDISWRTTGEPLSHALDLDQFLINVAGNVAALVPTHPLNYWDATSEGMVNQIDAIMLPALALIFFRMFRDNRRLLLIPALTAVGSIVVGQLIYGNSIRHWGINFVAFVAALWIQRVLSPDRSYFAVGLLAIGAVGGIAVSIQQFPLTFSEGRHTAEWIQDNGHADKALVGTADTFVAVVAQYLGKPIYFLDCSCTDTFLFYHNRRDAFHPRQMPERLARAVQELQPRPILFLTARPLYDSELAKLQNLGISATKLAAFDKAATDENFYVYRIAEAVRPRG